MMCFQVLVGSAQNAAFIISFFYLFYPVLIFFGVSHFIYIFAFGDVYTFIFIYHKVVPPLWVAIYTKRLKSKIVKYNIFYDYLIKRRFGCDKYFRPQQINEYFLLSRFFKLHFNHSIKCMLKLQVKVTPDFCSWSLWCGSEIIFISQIFKFNLNSFYNY